MIGSDPGGEGGPVRARTSIGGLVAACLRRHGVDLVFGIPGTHNLEIYRGLREQGIRHVLVRHEQGGTYAATGYARASGRPGVVVATTGPGVTNCITGLANAYADSVPLLVISPGAPLGAERRELGFLHESKDQRGGIDHFAAASIRAESAEAIVEAMQRVFSSFRTGRPRSMHIEVPLDLLAQEVEIDVPVPWAAHRPESSRDALELAAIALTQGQRPLIVAGGGAVDAGRELTELAGIANIPVVTTVQGKGAIDEEHLLAAGALTGGHAAFTPLAEADVVLAVGTELAHASLNVDATLIRVDIDPGQLHKHHAATIPLLGDAAHALGALAAHEPLASGRASASWSEHVLEAARLMRAEASVQWGALHRAILDGAADAGPGEVVLTGDSSRVSWVGTVRAAPLPAPRRFLTTAGYSTLGYALPAALGAKLALPEAHVIAVLGDGALMFTVQELATASELGVGLPVVVVDNRGYAEIRQNMVDAGVTPFGVDLTPPDYAQLAGAFGCSAAFPTVPQELRHEVRAALDRAHPTIITVRQEHLDLEAWRPECARNISLAGARVSGPAESSYVSS